MTARAADCGACKHWREGEGGEWRRLLSFHTAADGHWFACMAAHRPRFYKPRHEGDTGWGWRRCCEDFEPKEGL